MQMSVVVEATLFHTTFLGGWGASYYSDWACSSQMKMADLGCLPEEGYFDKQEPKSQALVAEQAVSCHWTMAGLTWTWMEEGVEAVVWASLLPTYYVLLSAHLKSSEG